MASKTLRVLTVFGTRPEAVKMAPVVKRLEQTAGVEHEVCVTAQHREMLDQILGLFKIHPAYDLNLMRQDQGLGELTAAVFNQLEPVYLRARPDWVLIQGDTTTVMAASLLAFYQQIRVGHVEAGLRTGDKWRPFPEEINRRVAGVVADLHFAPTERARSNLLAEKVPADWIVVTGNPVIDALHSILSSPYDFSTGVLTALPADRRLILVTAHRRENFGQGMENIFQALRRLAEKYAHEIHIVYPVHLNPNVREPAFRLLGGISNVTLIDPLDYHTMVHLMKRAYLILTDSGGIQEEAPALGTPVLVLREVTERPEALEAGTARLVGTDEEQIVAQTTLLLEDQAVYNAMANAVNPFGDGRAAERIVDALLRHSA